MPHICRQLHNHVACMRDDFLFLPVFHLVSNLCELRILYIINISVIPVSRQIFQTSKGKW